MFLGDTRLKQNVVSQECQRCPDDLRRKGPSQVGAIVSAEQGLRDCDEWIDTYGCPIDDEDGCEGDEDDCYAICQKTREYECVCGEGLYDCVI